MLHFWVKNHPLQDANAIYFITYVIYLAYLHLLHTFLF